jgi:hypothetical protein
MYSAIGVAPSPKRWARSTFFRAVGGRHGTGDYRRHVQIAGYVFLVAVEALRAALATVTHLGILDRDSSVNGDSLPNGHRPSAGLFEILISHH